MRWRVTDPQNRIRRLAPVADGTVSVEIVLPSPASADPAAIAAIERAAEEAGIEIERVTGTEAMAAAPAVSSQALPYSVVVNGVQYVPAHLLPS